MRMLLATALVGIAALALVALPPRGDSRAANDPYALNQSGLACYFGEGATKDLGKARELFLRAAEQGYAPAQVNLGMMYDHGDGVPRDYRIARQWYEKAADQGDRSGRIMLGYQYFYGLGVAPNPQKAMYYFLAANSEIKGDRDAVGMLSLPARNVMQVAAR